MKHQTEIIPAILVETFEEFTEKVRAVEDHTTWVQLDVADGDFAPRKTWGDPVEIHDYDHSVMMEVHLMVAEPEVVIDDWITGRSEERDSGIQRIYFHYESTSAHEEIIEKIKKAGKEAGIAILPETPLTVLNDLPQKLDAVLLFAGDLGFYGGQFEKHEEETLERVSSLRRLYPSLTIEIDGGMNPQNAKKVVDVGANAIVSGGYIFDSEDPAKAIEELKRSVAPE